MISMLALYLFISQVYSVTQDTLELSNFFRNTDGSGNNLANANWGKELGPYTRFVPNAYSDGQNAPPVGGPSPRVISNNIGSQDPNGFTLSSDGFSQILTNWGQFLDHDLTLTRAQNGNNLEQFPIPVPIGDPFFDLVENIPFTRSMIVTGTSPRRQVNEITPWIDGGMVYATFKGTADSLRNNIKGQMRTSANGSLLPLVGGRFIAGDNRVNENIGLSALTAVFVREHNRVCQEAVKLNASLTDEQLYQIAKNYVTGLIQKITIRDWLPKVIGEAGMARFVGEFKYDDTAFPMLPLEFASAAFRFGHHIQTNEYRFITPDGQIVKTLNLVDAFANPKHLKTGNDVDLLINGLVNSFGKDFDVTMIDEMRNFLILNGGSRKTFIDLFAFNIQRGRDHGLADYNSYREVFGLPRITDFAELSSNPNVVSGLRASYKDDFANIDLYSGLLCEDKSNGGILGETSARIIGLGFRKIINSDRFFYLWKYPPAVVQDIERTTLADIIARNTANTHLRGDVFFVPQQNR